MSQSEVKIINMSKFKPGRAGKNSPTIIGSLAGLELTLCDVGVDL